MIKKLYEWVGSYELDDFSLIKYRFVKLFLNIIYPIYSLFTKPNELNKDSDILVSITTYPLRIKKVHLVLETIFRQDNMPKKIILWLARNQFPDQRKIPSRLRKLEKYGLEIRFIDDLRSHKKYYYAFQNYPNYRIITIDDDVFYPENFINVLEDLSNSFPATVCTNRALQISTNNVRNQCNICVDAYTRWNRNPPVLEPRFDIVAIGCEGILYPRNPVSSECFNIEKIQKICPNADDLWLKSMEILAGIKTVKAKRTMCPFVGIIYINDKPLNKTNVIGNQNDAQLKNILNDYPDVITTLEKNI